ncbi:MAG: hypothetical protein HZB53_20390 [Chloroflexi bacterium]|nr:hypothetical protein [Chloroflexota bacterium]
MERHVRVTVNGQTTAFHLGLKVKHAIGLIWARKVRAHRAIVRDADGNRIDLDGALFDGQQLRVTDATEAEYWVELTDRPRRS